MKLLCHRGYRQRKSEQNSLAALELAILGGNGVETDIRDCDGELVISHDMPTSAFELERLRPQAHALSFALMTPYGVGVKHTLGGDGFDGRFARIPLDEKGDLARQSTGLDADLLRDFEGAQARVGAKQERQRGQLRSHRQDPLQVEFGLQRRVLHARAQSQLQAIAQRAQIGGGAGGGAVHALIGAPNGARVVHHKRVPVDGHVAAGQGTKVHGAGCVFGRQQGLDKFPGQLKPRGRMGVHALAQGRARRHCAHVQRAGEEVIAPKLFNRIEVVFPLHQQAQVGLQDVAVGDVYREFAVNAGTDSQAFHALPDQRQSGIGGEVVWQLFDSKVGHVRVHLLGESYMQDKSLNSIGKSAYFEYLVTDSGACICQAATSNLFYSLRDL
jgi:hypothetical protein